MSDQTPEELEAKRKAVEEAKRKAAELRKKKAEAENPADDLELQKKKAVAAAKAKAAALKKQKEMEQSEQNSVAEEEDVELAKKKAVAAAKAKAAALKKEKNQNVTDQEASEDDVALAKKKAVAAAKAKAAALKKQKEMANEDGGDDEAALAKKKAVAAAKAKTAALRKQQEAGSSDTTDEKAKAIAAAKAKAAAAKAKKTASETDEPLKEEIPSPNQPVLDRYLHIIRENLGDDLLEDAYINRLAKDVPTLVARKETYLKVAQFLKYNELLAFDYLSETHGTDFETHMEIYNHLYSYQNRQSIALKVKIDRDKPVIDSLTSLWAGANWPEREGYDLLGIVFNGHPNLTRIMMPDDWVGHPLRKDYEPYDVEV
ncbi:NADH-quinone oxidoreductase subunit C [Pseudalkalibacillus hwajinpoensis]|uniref:NADH-quinone oxidoreductase subunit C n=1 Tax=Guptibacillus hwajinpoensis TaxID=208199 RepID=UPI001CD53948|nr:NADH-quinone oxidoreductase subunit C [Pseudalkalibacillus hwajinpoensis]MCA0991237.1 NADH-quinone oxidoreductase subunit C [Pseudalkalibacillus hwajinpoensis]